MNTALTWDDIANIYDRHRMEGRRARTLPMETVMDWAEQRTDLFWFDEEGSVYLRQEN